MRILSLVPARGGSKRIPGKNIKLLGGKPLINWSIDLALQIPSVVDVLVSTDDSTTAEVARSAGAFVPWLRPKRLASDEATTVDVCLHALDWYETARGKVDGLLLLQPTSPFRRRQTIERGLEMYERSHCQPVVAVCSAASHPMSCFRIDGDTMRPFVGAFDHQARSQDLPPAFVVSGALYLISPDELRRSHSFYSERTLPLLTGAQEESIDIDTEWDWMIAEALLTIHVPRP